MKPRFTALLVAAGAIGLAGCGGSSHRSAGTVAAATGSAGPTALAARATTSSTGSSPASKGQRVHSKASSGGSNGSGAGSTGSSGGAGGSGSGAKGSAGSSHTSGSKGSHRGGKGSNGGSGSGSASAPAPTTIPGAPATGPDAGIPTDAHVSGPTPIVCLQDSNLTDAHATQLETWEGFDPVSHQPVFVDGPYGSHDAAAASAASFAGVLTAAAGGLYEVTAGQALHLEFWVNAVAKCLDATSGEGPLTYANASPAGHSHRPKS